jgi:hypothetical protein
MADRSEGAPISEGGLMANKNFYKILSPDGQSVHGGSLRWDLPKCKGRGWLPGDWHSVKPPIEVCSRGLHLVTQSGLVEWYKPATQVFLAEGAGAESRHAEKIAFERARLIRPVRPQYPVYFQKAIKFIEQEIPQVPWFEPDGLPLPSWELYRADSWDAAEDAAWAVAGDAAWDAARNAAWAVAEDAAWAVARNAARTVAWNAAWDAARNAAWDAARNAARAVAEDAARAVAGNAAWDAARDAELMAIVHICHGLKLEKIHREHIRSRWQVWRKGYAVLCDVNGVLYVYAGPSKEG